MALLRKLVVPFGANTLAQVTALSAQGVANSGGFFATKFCKRKLCSSLPPNIYFSRNLRPRHACMVDILALEHQCGMLHSGTEKLESGIKKRTEKLGSAIEKSAEKLWSALEKKVDKLGSDLEKRTEKLESDLEKRTEKLGSELEKMSSELRYAIRKGSNAIIADLEDAKYDFFKFWIGSLVSTFVVGTAVVHILM